MPGISVTPLEAVDNAFSHVIAECYDKMNSEAGTEALARFLARPSGERYFRIDHENVQEALKKIAYHRDEPGRVPDLPVVLYYREKGLVPDENQVPQVREVMRFISDKTVMSVDDAMRISTLPIKLTYSILFLAWDRPTIELLALAWWGHVVPARMRHLRFPVPYVIDGQDFDVIADLHAPQEVLTAAEPIDEKRRLWGSRTMAEVKTQVVYGEKVQARDYIRVVGTYDKVFR